MSSAERSRPITRLRNSAASEGVNRRSAARSSVSWPRARHRARGRRGSSRVAMTRCICGGRCSSRNARASSTGSESTTMVVVEDEDDTVRESRDLVEQGRQHRFGGWRLGRLEHAQHPLPNIRRDRPQSGDEVGQEARRIAVPFVQGKPGRTNLRFKTAAAGRPLADHRGLAEAGRGGHKDQPAPQTLVQPFDQAGAKNHVGPKRRDVELGGEDRRRHEAIIGHNPEKPQLNRAPTSSLSRILDRGALFAEPLSDRRRGQAPIRRLKGLSSLHCRSSRS